MGKGQKFKRWISGRKAFSAHDVEQVGHVFMSLTIWQRALSPVADLHSNKVIIPLVGIKSSVLLLVSVFPFQKSSCATMMLTGKMPHS